MVKVSWLLLTIRGMVDIIIVLGSKVRVEIKVLRTLGVYGNGGDMLANV